MGTEKTPSELRVSDRFFHIDMGFLNRRLCLSALPAELRAEFENKRPKTSDHIAGLQNDHLLVTMLIDFYRALEVPTIRDALSMVDSTHIFMSIERLEACPEIYDEARVSHKVICEFEVNKPVELQYHTSHIVSDTGRMTLASGAEEGYSEAIVARLHNPTEAFVVEPLVIGAPMLGHPRNGADSALLDWHSQGFGEILPEDIDEFADLKEVTCSDASEWMNVMKCISEETVKSAFAKLLSEPSKKDWGGEQNDHFSASLHVARRRRTAAFLFKGPSKFSEMVPAHCGKNGDQIYRLNGSGAEISIIQHCHLIGEAVRAELRAFVMQPGSSHRKYCFIDGQATYRILKAYKFI